MSMVQEEVTMTENTLEKDANAGDLQNQIIMKEGRAPDKEKEAKLLDIRGMFKFCNYKAQVTLGLSICQ